MQQPSDATSVCSSGASSGGTNLDGSPPSPGLYQTLFELMPGSVVLLDAQGVIKDANPAFCRQIGYAREELLGQHVSLLSKDSRETIERNLARLLAGEVLEHDVTNLHKDGSTRHYELRERAITLPDGSRGILALSNDITQRVTAEQEKMELLRQFLHAEKLKSLGLMAGGIAHDFNNLLAAIIGNIELSLLESNDQPLIQELLREGLQAANRAAHLTRQMLAYSGKSHFVTADLELNEIIHNMTEVLRAAISKKASLEVRLADGLPTITGDATQIQQIVLNLVANASEALEDKPGLIRLTTELRECEAASLASNRTTNRLKPGRYVVLEVSDSGCGMDDAVQQHLFDPFFTTKFTGRGLGMSAVMGAVRGHNGGIMVNSNVNRGTTISVLFPVELNRAASQAKLPLAETPGAIPLPQLTGTVLVADDEAVMRSMVERLLRRTGMRVLLAADGVEAVDLFKQHAHEITFVLLDLTMPRLDGVKTLAELRRHQPNVKAVLTSGYTEANISERGVREGFVAFFPKPYQAASLVELARKISVGEL